MLYKFIHSPLLADKILSLYNEYMNRSEARQAYWATVAPEIRSQHARNAALARHSKSTPEERRALALRLVAAKALK